MDVVCNKSAENGDYGHIFDANGIEIGSRETYLPIRCDTVTGWVEVALCENGCVKIDYEKGEIVKKWLKFSAPLKFVPNDNVYLGRTSNANQN